MQSGEPGTNVRHLMRRHSMRSRLGVISRAGAVPGPAIILDMEVGSCNIAERSLLIMMIGCCRKGRSESPERYVLVECLFGRRRL
jgi:hypothetical protein